MDLNEHEKPAGYKASEQPTIVCSKCGTRHMLTDRSFMMSPRQALARLTGSGMLVIQADGVSREYLVGELDTFPAEAQTDLKMQTEAAIAEAVEELKKGQDLTWRCRRCDYDRNKFPVEWYRDKSEQPRGWPYPSDGFFREASKKLVADHGTVVRVTDCGSLAAVRWRFTYKDGHEVVVGNPGWPEPTMKVDVDFFPGTVGFEGRTYAKVFFSAAGLDISGLDIFDMPNGASYDVGKLLEDGGIPRKPENEAAGVAAKSEISGTPEGATYNIREGKLLEGVRIPPKPETKAGVAARSKLLIGAVLAVVLVAGLYLINRYWIHPAVMIQANGDVDHPDAPAISLTDIEGKRLDLADYKGKVVVLDFWATWCGPCRAEIPGFVMMQEKYASQGFSMIGISMDDDAAPVVDFYKEFKMNYPVAVGNQRIGELYGGILGLPTTFLIGRDGRIYAKHTGGINPAIIEEEVQQLLAMSPTTEKSDFKPVMVPGTETKVALGDPATIDSEIPGLNLTKLTAEEKEALKKQLSDQHCPCGCKLTVMKCRQVDRACQVSLKLAREQMGKSAKPGA